jgi:hypothetical protein
MNRYIWVSACLLAGFQHAIGHIARVTDDDFYGVARIFYETLQKEGKTDRAVYWAHHKAVKIM